MSYGLFVLLLLFCGSAVCQRCSRDRMRQCDDSLRRNTQRRINDMNRMDMSSHCEVVRDDFNCLLQETRCLSTETERNRNGDTLRNALKYIRDGCDSSTAGGKGSWRDSSCFVGDPMKTCESSYPLGGVQYASYNPETCRKYNLFYDCARDTVRSRCRPEDERLMGQYLVDSAQDLAWNCGDQTSTSDTRDDRFDDRRNDRRQYDRYNDRDRLSDRERDGYRSGSGGYRDSYNDRDRDRYGGSNGYGRGDYSSSGDISCCRSERCDRGRQQECRDTLSKLIDQRSGGYQDAPQCRRIRDAFNCLMWHTSNCMARNDRDRDNDIFRRARDFISRTCDTFGRWSENSCYKSSEMQRCEALLTDTRGGANYEACRSFLSFRDCMTSALRSRCTREDDIYQGAYMVDKAQEMSWQCGTATTSSSSYDRDNDRDRDRYNGGGGYRGDTYDRKDRYDNYDNGPVHLDDEDANCAGRIQTYTDQCKDNYERKRRDLYSENDFYNREKITCCSVRLYRNCLYDATRRYCQSERSRVVDNLMAGQRHILQQDSCARIYDSECSAATANLISTTLLCACVTLLAALFSFHR